MATPCTVLFLPRTLNRETTRSENHQDGETLASAHGAAHFISARSVLFVYSPETKKTPPISLVTWMKNHELAKRGPKL